MMAVATYKPELRLDPCDADAIFDLDLIQGLWTAEQYLRLTAATNRLIEFTDGRIEVLPMPTQKHQMISRFLFLALHTLMQQIGGTVLYSPLRLYLREDKYREPDLLLLRYAEDPRGQDEYWLGADLVVEIVSPDNAEHDTVEKRAEYAEARIPEYWIVNPQAATITVLRLVGAEYVEHGVFIPGDTATSVLLDGFTIAVSEVFAAH